MEVVGDVLMGIVITNFVASLLDSTIQGLIYNIFLK